MRFTCSNNGRDEIAIERDGASIATVHFDDAPHGVFALTMQTALLYAEEIAEALQRRFGTAEAVAPADATFFGLAIPPALAEVAPLLVAAERLDPTRRSKPMVDAITRFIAYCDAEGIVLPRKPPPAAADP